MKKFLVFFFLANSIFAQSTSKDTTSYAQSFLDRLPDYPGGKVEMEKFISENMDYSIKARRMGIEGKVVVKFIVEKTGELTHFQIEKGIYYDLDQEALRIVKAFPNWIPGEIKSEKVRALTSSTIHFDLSEKRWQIPPFSKE